MEFSSPLAAMHPPPGPVWGGRRDLPTSRLMYSGSQSLAPNNFNFKDLSMHRGNNDYFSRPTRGSSPTASLAADLSSNFHIDQSPQVPTPRRSLFSRNMLFSAQENKDLLVTPPVDYEGATTPPIPSSSPGIDCMDISPLPHKAPCFVAHITLPSPSPDPTPDDDDVMMTPQTAQSEPMPMAVSPSMSFQITTALPERKKPTLQLQRPPLLRPKTYSPTSAPAGPSKESLLPPFQFGTVVPTLTSASTPDLLSDVIDSPMEDQRASPFLAGHRRTSLGGSKGSNGSPINGVSRKPALGVHRPRKQVRRSLSMFQHPEDVMKDREDYEPPIPSLSPSQDVNTEYKHKLPHTLADEPDSLPRIQQDTLINVLNGQYNAHYDKVLVVDCRFEYEYEGGHIEGAVNYNDKALLAKELFGATPPPRTLLIFHCEYSVHRAPRMAKFVRNQDRTVNDFQYPKLTYPEMYILDGGYSQFFKQNRTKCFPQNYVEMEHKDHERACEKGMGKLKQRAKLGRAQTFAFGQQSCQMEDSPTSGYGSRAGARSYSTLEANDLSPMMARQFTRRLATA
ncbi:Rhodanese-like protein [Myriangium duriaei CBS 260.36]|uniref:M-phase inducer phosphatase n=1 Tax=Myriangium duriaei CBS 260.36 TaxID=1168546 RepID=A0A9P4JA85_9PEZI|nr:Rhodanese-like protein [Myriangium duriaei CBS 260.36]